MLIPTVDTYSSNPEPKRALVRWSTEECALVAQAAFDAWKINFGMSTCEAINAGIHKSLPVHRWRKITSPVQAPEVLVNIKCLHAEFLASLDKPAKIIHTHTKEEVMLPPDQVVKLLNNDLYFAELGRRIGQLMHKLDNMEQPVQEAPPPPQSQAPVKSPPRIVKEKQRIFHVAIIGPLKRQFNEFMEAFNGVAVLKEMFVPVWYDKDKQIHLADAVDLVITTSHISHRVEFQAIAQLESKGRLFHVNGTTSQLIQKLLDTRSRILACMADPLREW